MKRTTFCFVIIGFLLIICSGGVAFAQSSTNSDISGYFVNVNGQSTGPYDNYGLKQLISQGQLTKSSLVLKEGMPSWVVAGAVEEMAPLFSSVTPPPLQSAQTPPPLQSSQTPPPVSNQDPQASVPPEILYDENYPNFTSGQRWGTFGLNLALPGLGSFVIMHDKKGGRVNMGLGFTGYGLFIVSYIFLANSYDVKTKETDMGNFYAGVACIALGSGFEVATLIHNIVRSSRYNRPPQAISLVDPNHWQIAVIPGRSGIEAVSLSYKMEF